jgi:hypothetical protein
VKHELSLSNRQALSYRVRSGTYTHHHCPKSSAITLSPIEQHCDFPQTKQGRDRARILAMQSMQPHSCFVLVSAHNIQSRGNKRVKSTNVLGKSAPLCFCLASAAALLRVLPIFDTVRKLYETGLPCATHDMA